MRRVLALGWRAVRRSGIFLLGALAMVDLEAAVAVTGSMLLSLAVYAWAFGWQFALGFILLILAHEMGHVAASWVVGIKARGPMFIPFLGAVVSLRRPPVNAKMEANVAVGGPAAGTLSALICLVFHLWTGSTLLLVLTYTACVLNLFNLIPCGPLDGSKIAAAMSPRSWWVGSAAVFALFVFTHSLFFLAIFLFSLLRLWRQDDDPSGRYYDLSVRQRLRVAWWYFGLLTVLGFCTIYVVTIMP